MLFIFTVPYIRNKVNKCNMKIHTEVYKKKPQETDGTTACWREK